MSARPDPEGVEPQAPDADDPHVVHEHALRLVELRRPDEALEVLARGLARHPEDDGLLALRVSALLVADRDEDALREARALAALQPHWAWPRTQAGWALVSLDRDAEAREEAVAAMELDPEAAAPHLLLSQAAMGLGDEPLAREAALAARERDPEDPRAHAVLGDLDAARSRHEQALGHYDEALRLDPEEAGVHERRGVALQWLTRTAEAHAAFATAARLDPRASRGRTKLLRSVSRNLFGHVLPFVVLALLAVGLLLVTSTDTLRGGLRAVWAGLFLGALVLVRARYRLRRLGEAESRAVAGLGWWGRFRSGFVDPALEQVPAGWGLAVGGLLAVAVGLAVLTAPPEEALGPAPALAVAGLLVAGLDARRLLAARRGRSS